MNEVGEAKKRWGWRRLLAAAVLLIAGGVCAFLAWTADPGVSTFLNLNDGSGNGVFVTHSTAESVERLRRMVHPDDPTMARYRGLEPLLRSRERDLSDIETKQTVYAVVAAVLALMGTAILIFGRRVPVICEDSRTPGETASRPAPSPRRARRWLAVSAAAGLVLIAAALLLRPVETEVVMTSIGAGPSRSVPEHDQAARSDRSGSATSP